jgi:Protein of unknown function (DUF2917)
MTTNTHILWRRPKGQQFGDTPCSETIEPATKTLFPLRGKYKSLVIEKCLPMKSLLQLPGDHRGEKISCLNGVIWITQSGNPEDILLCAGGSFTITQKGTILIQGLVETRLKIISLYPTKTGWHFPSILL